MKTSHSIAAAALLGTSALVCPRAAAESPLAELTSPKRSAPESFSGALAHVSAPQYEGPIRWRLTNPPGEELAAAIAVGGLFGAVVGVFWWFDSERKEGHQGLGLTRLLGRAAGCGAVGVTLTGLAMHPFTPYQISFSTTVSSVPFSSEALYVDVKTRDGWFKQGPFNRQVVSIPESPIPLEGYKLGTPLRAGQQITAHFVVEDGNVVSWYATPAW